MQECQSYGIKCLFALSDMAPVPCVGTQEQCDQVKKIRRGQNEICKDCFLWDTVDCKKYISYYPQMPIWRQSKACDKFKGKKI